MRVRPLIALAALLLPGCVSDGTDFEALPFYAEDRTRRSTVVSRTVPAILTAVDEVSAKREEVEKGGTGSVIRIAWPIVQYGSEGREHEFRFFGSAGIPGFLLAAGPAGRAVIPGLEGTFSTPKAFFPKAEPGGLGLGPVFGFDSVHVDPADPEETKHDYGVLPAFLGGSSKSRGDYLAVAPFGGTTKGLLGKEKMTWYGFPYPFYLHVQDGAYESRHALFPFVNWVSGPQHDGFRIFPLYAHYEKKDLLGRDSYDRTWVMWPFFTRQTNTAGSGEWDEEGDFHPDPTEVLFLFPFFGKIRGRDLSGTTVLWPLFRWEEQPGQGYWELRAPFPVLTIHGGTKPERSRFDVWPLGGYRTRDDYTRHFFLWPVERYESRDDKWVRDVKLYVLPLLSHHFRREKASGDEWSRTRVWPVVFVRSGARGELQVHALAPLLWDDPDGFERLVLPFLRLYEYQRSADGGSHHRVLLGLASVRQDPARGDLPRYDRLSLLFGMFQWREKGGENAVRLFWLPELPSWGGPPR